MYSPSARSLGFMTTVHLWGNETYTGQGGGKDQCEQLLGVFMCVVKPVSVRCMQCVWCLGVVRVGLSGLGQGGAFLSASLLAY